MKLGEPVIISGCPPRNRWVSFKRESNGVLVGGYHPEVFRRYYSPNPQGVVLFEDGKFKLTINGSEVIANTMAEAEALQLQARRV